MPLTEFEKSRVQALLADLIRDVLTARGPPITAAEQVLDHLITVPTEDLHARHHVPFFTPETVGMNQ